MKKLITAALLGLSLAACSSGQQHKAAPATTSPPTTVAAPPSTVITPRHLTENVIAAFKCAGLPIGKVVFYTEETDPNKMLNRPGGYVLKVNWTDRRAGTDTNDGDPLSVGSIEVFEKPGGAAERVEYLQSFGGILASWAFQVANSNFVLRLDKVFTKAQAKQYRSVMERELTR